MRRNTPTHTYTTGPEVAPPFSPLTMFAMLDRTWSGNAGSVAMAFVGEPPLLYSDLRDRVVRVASFLREAGVKKGDKVAILSENHPHWGAAFFATTAIGAVSVPVMHEFPSPDVTRILDDSKACVLFASEKTIAGKMPVLPRNVRYLVRLEDLKVVHDRDEAGIAVPDDPIAPWESLRSADVGEGDAAALIFTSGTSSLSKGIVLTHKNLLANAVATNAMIEGMSGADRMLSILPLAHTTECTLGMIIPVMQGASVYYLRKPPAAATLLPALEAVRPTVMLAVPLVIEKLHRNRIQPKFRGNALVRALYGVPLIRKSLNKLAGRKLARSFGGCLRMFCIGGAALSPEVELFLREARFPYTVGYGLTETAPLVTGTLPDRFVFGSCGQPLPGVTVRIDSPDPVTGEGEILVKGPNVMAGYHAKDGAEPPVQPYTADGWLRTGDLGVLNGEGFLFIRGRLKNMVVHSNGKNTYPEAVEQLIHEHRFVEEALVYFKDKILRAAVHLNREELVKFWNNHKVPELDWERETGKILEKILAATNRQLPPWSRLKRIDIHPVPFEKTPSKKVKRYLYVPG